MLKSMLSKGREHATSRVPPLARGVLKESTLRDETEARTIPRL